jgi:uncharacterized protein
MSHLLEFEFKNFISFREGARISFEIDANCPPHISNDLDFTTVIGVKGANGSGKTNVLKAISFLVDFARNSWAKDPDEVLAIAPFFGSDQPCEFCAKFRIKEYIYEYELVANNSEVVSEKLSRTRSKRSVLVERDRNKLDTTSEFRELREMQLKSNASFISTARQYQLATLKPVYEFFDRCLSNVNFRGPIETFGSTSAAAKFLNEDQASLDFVREFLSSCDTGISNVTIEKRASVDEKRPPAYYPRFHHIAGESQISITEDDESHGTRSLFRILPIYRAALQRGGMLILDEFDAFLHPFILQKLVDLFSDPTENPNSAQLLFSTHNTEILDSLGRYRTYLVNKVDNESFAYRLDEIPGDLLRNDRRIVPPYLEGKIGGVPRL